MCLQVSNVPGHSAAPWPSGPRLYNPSMTPKLAPILDMAELRAIEAQHAGQPLMERAGLAAAEVAREISGNRGGQIVILAAGSTTSW